jgi:hypothetical protein
MIGRQTGDQSQLFYLFNLGSFQRYSPHGFIPLGRKMSELVDYRNARNTFIEGKFTNDFNCLVRLGLDMAKRVRPASMRLCGLRSCY